MKIMNLHLEKIDYIDKFEIQLKDLKRKANLKGFRPGMVPIQLLKNMYGKSVLLEEINKIVSESINNYIKENRIVSIIILVLLYHGYKKKFSKT